MSLVKSDDITARIGILEQQIIDQKEATVLALAAADKAILNAYFTAEKAVAKVELAAEKTYLESQIGALREAFKQQIAYQAAAADAALAASDKAVLKAEHATEKRFEGVNEFRKALNDQQTNMLPRMEFDVQCKAIIERVGLQTKRLEDLQLQFSTYAAQNQGKTMGFGLIGSLVMGGIAVLSVSVGLVTFLTRFIH